jgi:alginate O-acetyltransferase complex protein AlgI
MLFPTPTFGLFLILVVLGATLLSERPRLHHAFLLAASYLFYAAWDPRFLVLIIFSTMLDYSVGLALASAASARSRKWLLTASLVGNLGVLCTFKYYDFFADSLVRLLDSFGYQASIPVLNLILPVGISFYTFQTLSYTIDIYRGDLEARTSLLDVALFVGFFPQLVAGPIVRARNFLPQLDHRPRYDAATSSSGLYFILKGLTKKVLFADLLGSFLVNPAYSDPESYTGAWVLLAWVGFALQIYGDFSGYSDVAIGSARLLGFELPVNFRSPFKATSFTDFWRRWHLTLGAWFHDYLYRPLVGFRSGFWKSSLALLLTMTLVGLWHGAAWTFVVWGLCHGLYLFCERGFRHLRGKRRPTPWLRPFKMLVVFSIGVVTLAVFRAPSMGHFWQMISAIRTPAIGLDSIPPVAWGALTLAFGAYYAPERWKEGIESAFVHLPAFGQALVTVVLLTAFRVTGAVVEPFYYFQF